MRSLIDRLPPSVIALVLQAAAFIFAILLVRITSLQLSPLVFALLCGTVATLLSHLAGLARWWLLIQLLFIPALVAMLFLHLPPTLYLVIFLLMLVVYWSTFRTQVPLYLSSSKIGQAMELLLPLSVGMEVKKQNFSFMDLGSGLGGLLTHLARVRPEGFYHGIEVAPLPFLLSWLRIRLGGYHNCQVKWGNLWDCDLVHYDVVFAYLSPVPMDKLWQKARREMRPGSAFISNTFAVIDHPPQQTFTVDDLHKSTLYIWLM
jgi:hypothetical protein